MPTSQSPANTHPCATPQEAATRLAIPLAVLDYQVTRRRRVHLLHLPGSRHHFVAHYVSEILKEADRHGYDELILTPDPYTHEPLGVRIRIIDTVDLPLDPPQPPDIP